MKLRVVVPGKVVSKNRSKGWSRRTGFYLPAETKEWMRFVAVHAIEAARAAEWPANPFMVSEASIRFDRFNVGGDPDAGNTYVVDALQFTRWPNISTEKATKLLERQRVPEGEAAVWLTQLLARCGIPFGIVGNDRDLWVEASPPSRADAGRARLELTITLLGIRAPAEAERLRERWYANEARRRENRRARAKGRVETASQARQRDELAELERRTGLPLFRGTA